jgi:hypothetical protein
MSNHVLAALTRLGFAHWADDSKRLLIHSLKLFLLHPGVHAHRETVNLGIAGQNEAAGAAAAAALAVE